LVGGACCSRSAEQNSGGKCRAPRQVFYFKENDVDIRKALEYVRTHGTALERARAETLVAWMPPTPEAVQSLEQAQGPDGGWPLELTQDRPSTLPGTCEALALAHDWGLLEVPMVERGLTYLQSQQQPDGSWEDTVAPGAPTPRWLTQGEEAGRLYVTAWVSSLLAAYNRHNEPGAGKALDLLLKYQLEGGLFAGFPRHIAWYALPILARVLGVRSGPAQNILLALSRELAEPGWFPSMFAGMLYNLLLAGYSMETPLVRATWEQLLMRQREDGAWASEDGDAGDVRSTLEVMRCWRRIVQK
jgi:hypothetical protein